MLDSRPMMLALLLAVSGGCTEQDVPNAMVQDSAGVLVTVNPAPTVSTEWEPFRRAGPEVDLGGPDAAGPFLFQDLIDAVELPGRALAVADRGRKEVLLYDSLGAHLRTLGGPGDGPGEFRDIGALQLVGDSLFVFDWRLGRLTAFALDGDLLGTVSLADTADGRHPIQTYNLAGTLGPNLLLAPWAIMPGGQSSVGVYWDTGAVLLYSMDGALEGEISEPYETEMYVGTGGSAGRPFGARTTLVSDGTRLFMGNGKDFVVRGFDSVGVLRQVIRRDWTPRPVTAELVDSLMHFRLGQLGIRSRTDSRGAAVRARIESAPMPDRMPAFSGMMIDGLGRLWVRSYSPPWEDTSIWSMFDQDGVWLRDVQTPERFDILGFGTDHVLGRWRDPLDVQHFQVYRLDGPAL